MKLISMLHLSILLVVLMSTLTCDSKAVYSKPASKPKTIKKTTTKTTKRTYTIPKKSYTYSYSRVR